MEEGRGGGAEVVYFFLFFFESRTTLYNVVLVLKTLQSMQWDCNGFRWVGRSVVVPPVGRGYRPVQSTSTVASYLEFLFLIFCIPDTDLLLGDFSTPPH